MIKVAPSEEGVKISGFMKVCYLGTHFMGKSCEIVLRRSMHIQ
jgi:hypothetical protein